MSFKQRKPRTAATRQRDTTGDGDGDGDDDLGSGISPMAAAQARKKREGKKKVGGAAALSFADEGDETPAFVPKKSTLSQSISLQKLAHKNTAQDLPSSVGLTSTPSYSTTYSNDYLAQLKAATPTRATLAREPDVIVPYDDDDDGRAASTLTDPAPAIPDEAAIASAITRRRRLAADPSSFTATTTQGPLGSDADYVSLNADTSRLAVYDPSSQPHPESRLQRESDSEGSGDEALAAFTGAHERIRVGKRGNEEAARRMRREMRDALGDEEVGGGDEDEERWEVEQVRRAGIGAAEEPKGDAVRAYTSAKIPAVRPLPTPTSAAARLTTSLSYLVASQSTTVAQLAANERERARLEEQEADVRREVERVEAKREWMQGFVGWVELLGGFLEDKVPVLDKIEADGRHHWTQRWEMITRRRRDDDADDVALFLGVAPVAADAEPEVDELGRTRRDDSGPYASVRKYRRQARATRRQARARPAPVHDAEEGYSTDSSLASADAEDYTSAQASLRDRAAQLDADVKAEEFLYPERGIGARFAAWREREPEEYGQAFGGLGCVQGWEYWARKEMVGWGPSRSSRSVDSFEWFHALHAYSHPHRPRAADEMATSDDDEDEEPPLAPEGDMAAAMVASLVSRLVERAVAAGEYDIYSLPQTRRLGDLVDLISGYTEKEGQKYKALLKAVLGAFLQEAQLLVTLVTSASQPDATPPPAFDPAARSALSAFTHRRLKLIKNMLIWRRYAPQEIQQLIGMVLSQVIRPCLTRCWDSGGKELADKVMHVVPESLMTVDVVAFFKAAK